MKSLLIKDNNYMELNHNKWFRNLEQSKITIKNQGYKLSRTKNKRNFIYSDQGIAIKTKAFVINKKKNPFLQTNRRKNDKISNKIKIYIKNVFIKIVCTQKFIFYLFLVLE